MNKKVREKKVIKDWKTGKLTSYWTQEKADSHVTDWPTDQLIKWTKDQQRTLANNSPKK